MSKRETNQMSKQSITVSARVGFEAIDQIDERLKGVNFPIELALPYRYVYWKEAVLKFERNGQDIEKKGYSLQHCSCYHGKNK